MTQKNTDIMLFKLLPEQQISSDNIETRVMIRIKHSRTLHARVYFMIHISTIFVAIAICVPVVHSFATSASQTGLTSYLSLFSTDGTSVLSSWKDLGLSIVESIPVIETTTILSLVLVIGNALRRGTHYLPALHQREHAMSAS